MGSYDKYPSDPSINEVVDQLRSIAWWDTAANEFTASEHLCWIAADIIEDLTSEEVTDE